MAAISLGIDRIETRFDRIERRSRSRDLANRLTQGFLFRPRAQIAGPRADQNAALVLLDRVGDPADRAAYDKETESGLAGEPQTDRRCGEGEIDIWPTPDQTQPGFRRPPPHRPGGCCRAELAALPWPDRVGKFGACSESARGGERSFDHLVGAGEDRRGDRHAERPRHFQIDHQLEPGRLPSRRIGR